MRVLQGSHRGWPKPTRPSVIAVGVFDGVHRGHRAVLTAAGRSADARGYEFTVLTFDPHPMQVIDPERIPRLLTTTAQKLRIFEELGVETTAVLRFDDEVRRLEAEAFAEDVLDGGLEAGEVVIGGGFRFGHGRKGDAEALRDLGRRLGFVVVEVDLVGDNEPVSSTTIRAALAAGNVEQAARDLGRHHEVEGIVVTGAGRGVAIGVPTANLSLDGAVVVPARGVYAVMVRVGGEEVAGVANVGIRPTFGKNGEVVEAHLFDFSRELYGERLGISFVSRLRDERTFDSVEALAAQIRRDIGAARRLLAVPEQQDP